MIVEDSLDLAVVMRRLLATVAPDAELDWVDDAVEGAERIRSRSYDLVLADHYLEGSSPGMTLFEVCRRIQPRAMFAMMSSLDPRAFLALAGERRIPLLRKPFTAAECCAFLESALARKPRRKELARVSR